jgi:hypothetical protein
MNNREIPPTRSKQGKGVRKHNSTKHNSKHLRAEMTTKKHESGRIQYCDLGTQTEVASQFARHAVSRSQVHPGERLVNRRSTDRGTPLSSGSSIQLLTTILCGILTEWRITWRLRSRWEISADVMAALDEVAEEAKNEGLSAVGRRLAAAQAAETVIGGPEGQAVAQVLAKLVEKVYVDGAASSAIVEDLSAVLGNHCGRPRPAGVARPRGHVNDELDNLNQRGRTPPCCLKVVVESMY